MNSEKTNLKALFSTVLILAASLSASAQLEWERLMPEPTENAILDLVFINPSQGVMCTSFETFSTSDGGESWEGVEIGGTTRLEAYGQVIAALKDGRAYFSYDGGSSWELKFDGVVNGVSLIDISFSSSNEITLLGRDSDFIKRLYRSIDEGESWDTLDVAMPNNADLLRVVEGDTLFFGWSDDVYKTENGGITFSLAYENPNENAQIRQLQIINDSTIVGIDEDGGFFKTNDRGETWVTNNIIQSWINANLSDMHFSDPMHGFVVSFNHAIYRTTDGGNSWIELPDFDFFTFPDFMSIYTLSPETLFGGGEGGLFFKTDDVLETTSSNAIPLDRAESIELADENTAFVKGNNMLYRYDLETEEVVEVQPYWQGSDTKNAFIFFNDETGLGLDQDGMLRKTSDGATSWSEISPPEMSDALLTGFEFVDEENGIVLDESSVLWKTNNGGANWEEIFQGDVQLFDVVTANLFFLINRNPTGQMKLLRSTDGGENWTELADLFAFFFNELYFVNESTGFINSNFGTDRTENAGENWEIVDSNVRKIQFINENIGLAIASEVPFGNEVHYTNDGGLSWSPTGPNSGAIDYSLAGDRIVTFNLLHAIHTSLINALSVDELSPTSESLVVYPNPARDHLTVAFPEGQWSTYEVVDISGKVVIREKVQTRESLQIDLSRFTSGLYLIRIVGENQALSTKVLKK